MGWYQLLDILHEAADRSLQGWDREAEVCPNDGEPLKNGPNGELFCPFDGFRPDVTRPN